MKNLFHMVTLAMVAGLIAGYSANCSNTTTAASCPGPNCLPACSDGVLTAPETDIDCGGDICAECGTNKKCNRGSDCATHACVSGTCQDPTCADAAMDGAETDVDCGGTCPKCEAGKGCNVAGDCATGICTGGRCAPPACTDGVKNGPETDVDCGGTCPVCNLGKGCGMNSDCAPYLCDNGKCGLGTGADGPLTIATGTNMTINSVGSPVTGTQGGTTATLGNATGFAAGQTIFLHQTQGTGAGNHELNRIVSLNGTAATLLKPLAYTYVTGSQMVVVPQYTTVSVAAGGAVTAPTWNGGRGGILVFQATGAVTLDGAITMNSRGFRGGGDPVACFPGSPSGAGCVLNNGRYGESEKGASAFTTQDSAGYGVSNGSGGGGGTRGQDCAAGGGGSHGTSGSPGGDGSPVGTCVVNGKHGGGVAGAVMGSRDLTPAIFVGGGGGEGGPDEDGTHPGHGGNGGGMIVFLADSLTVNAAGVIDVSGAAGGTGVNAFGGCGGGGGGMGNGGGGAGGAIRAFIAGAAALGNNRVVSLGGAGGTGGCTAGGPGGVGRIHVRASTPPSGTTNPAPYID